MVTPQGTVTGKAPRSVAHGNPDLLHPVVHVHVFNSAGKLWLQKRAMCKKIQPGKWDTSVGGHFSSGENIQQALYREVLEELGVPHLMTKPLYHYVMRNNIESELVYTFQGFHEGPFQWPADEIDTGRFWSINEIKKNIGTNIFTPNFEQEFAMLQRIRIVK
ncbi:NUDIX domain-containing protein [bacterium]|nr:NUDIX domain-containing protein [bacterium]